jgi:hypothetical protein
MRLRPLFAAALFALFPLPFAASAVPIEIELVGDTAVAAIASTSAFGAGCSSRSNCGTQVIGTLHANMDGDLITGVRGNVLINGLGSVDVLDGAFDFTGRTSSFFVTNLFGSFQFNQVSWNSGYFSFWGGNWSNGCDSLLGCKLLWLRLRGHVEPTPVANVPEPSAALLFGAGAFLVSRRVSRRR